MRMLDPPAEIRAAVDLAAVERRWKALDTKEQKTIAEIRTERGHLLVEARKGFSDRGDGFVKFVEETLRIPYQTAQDWMKAVGYVPPKRPGAGRKATGNQNESRYDSSPAESGEVSPATAPASPAFTPLAFIAPPAEPAQEAEDESGADEGEEAEPEPHPRFEPAERQPKPETSALDDVYDVSRKVMKRALAWDDERRRLLIHELKNLIDSLEAMQ